MKTATLMSILLALLTAGCATSPSDNITQAPDNDVALAEVAPDIDKFLLSPVRWGGRIVKTTEIEVSPIEVPPTSSGSNTNEAESQPSLLVEILEFPLDAQGEPLTSEPSSGRFIALIKYPYKKSAFYRNRYITVAGKITDKRERPLPNGQVQQFPVVTSQDKYTWIRNDDDRYHRFWPSFFYGFGVSKNNVGFGVIFH